MSSSPAPAPVRIASLLPSATEIVCSLGLEEALVAVSHSCDFPGRIESLPRVTRTRVPHGVQSREIDAVVRDCLHSGESLYQLDEALLESLRPDLIVTQALCEVCAVGPAEVGRAVPALSSHPRIVTLEPRTLEEVFGAIEAVGAAVGRSESAAALVKDLRRRVEVVRSRSAALARRPRVPATGGPT
jgi:iron complex transport system substrate-binding protein